MKKVLLLLLAASFASLLNAQVPYSSGYSELDEWTQQCLRDRTVIVGGVDNYTVALLRMD